MQTKVTHLIQNSTKEIDNLIEEFKFFSFKGLKFEYFYDLIIIIEF